MDSPPSRDPADAAHPADRADPADPARRRWRGTARFLRHPFVVLAIVAVVAGVPRFWALGDPGSDHGHRVYVFDETYYAKDACLYAGHTPSQCDLTTTTYEQSWVHPPLGKWMIALGIKLFGYDPIGYRFSSALFGTASVVITAGIALLLFGSVGWAYVAGLLLATESLNFVQSRVALLDIFVAFWVVLGFLFVVLDRRYIDRRTRQPDGVPEPTPAPALSMGPGAMAASESAGPGAAPRELDPDQGTLITAERPPAVQLLDRRVPSPLWRPWRLAAGLAFGGAFATKWNGLPPLLGAAGLVFVWEWMRRRRAGTRGPLWGTIRQEGLTIFVSLALLPLLVYVGSYSGRIIHTDFPKDRYVPGAGWHFSLPQLWELQGEMAHFHETLYAIDPTTHKPAHPYESRPWSWLYLGRPVAYYYVGPGTEILGIGNPAIFWFSLLTIPWLGLALWRRRDWVAGLIFVAIAVQYVPWFIPPALNKVQFLFYATPISPFLALAATYVVRDMATVRVAGSRSRPFLPVAVGFVAVCVGLFVFFWPILTAYPLSHTAWSARMWFRSWI
ncbi:MAG: phospholipid carrier-dependent glycosyltransferase [Actinomycetota bacterium]|nr:phospholipid carrier-dependent glycosyltransferase [Actinomycetota bacterium]